jgi:hypothetical protein
MEHTEAAWRWQQPAHDSSAYLVEHLTLMVMLSCEADSDGSPLVLSGRADASVQYEAPVTGAAASTARTRRKSRDLAPIPAPAVASHRVRRRACPRAQHGRIGGSPLSCCGWWFREILSCARVFWSNASDDDPRTCSIVSDCHSAATASRVLAPTSSKLPTG